MTVVGSAALYAGEKLCPVENGGVNRLMEPRCSQKDRARLIAPYLVGLDQTIDREALADGVESRQRQPQRRDTIGIDDRGKAKYAANMIATLRANVRRYPGWIMLLELIVQKRTDMRKLQYRKYKHRSYDQGDTPVEPVRAPYGSLQAVLTRARSDRRSDTYWALRMSRRQGYRSSKPSGRVSVADMIRWQNGRPLSLACSEPLVCQGEDVLQFPNWTLRAPQGGKSVATGEVCPKSTTSSFWSVRK